MNWGPRSALLDLASITPPDMPKRRRLKKLQRHGTFNATTEFEKRIECLSGDIL